MNLVWLGAGWGYLAGSFPVMTDTEIGYGQIARGERRLHEQQHTAHRHRRESQSGDRRVSLLVHRAQTRNDEGEGGGRRVVVGMCVEER
jgi:hypothetical protein